MTDTRTHEDQTTAASADSSRVRNEIDDTREHLGQTVEAIGDRVLPGRIIERRKETTAKSLRGLRDRIMGTAHDTREQLADSAGSTVDHLREAPGSVAQRTEGSPLAAGGVAFAIGFLAAAVWRPTETGTPGGGEGGRRCPRPDRRRRPAGPRRRRHGQGAGCRRSGGTQVERRRRCHRGERNRDRWHRLRPEFLTRGPSLRQADRPSDRASIPHAPMRDRRGHWVVGWRWETDHGCRASDPACGSSRSCAFSRAWCSRSERSPSTG